MSEFVYRDVAQPLQRMVSLVRNFAEDPLKPLPETLSAAVLDHPLRETVILERALVRLSCLLQLGFGEAGAAMVGRSLQRTPEADVGGGLGENYGKILNVGRVVHAFFGFCDICYFTDLTEILQADVVRVVNSVAKIIHRSVKDNSGAPNKNMGDTFLLVWMCRAGLGVRTVADASLRSFIRAVLEVSRSKDIRKMSQRSDVQTRMPGFKVQLGFGLHYGWAVECAIGSDLKVDASYLSPNVNLASRLQAATKQYGVEILISGQTHSLFSPSVQAMCRQVDRVTLKGTVHPMDLFTYDVPATTVDGISVVDDHIISSPDTTHQLFFSALQPALSDRFRQQFSAAMELYLGGHDGSQADWKRASQILSQLCNQSGPRDGPSQAIRSYIKRRARPDGSAPQNWKGYRALESK
uniref:Guanylate cyclase domain-containing protein n=1 Tax=Hemiselmis tepida TaxID=464990 RepID=A0A7S0VFA6_9CRYP